MRIFAFADSHGYREREEGIIEHLKSQKFDLCVGCGDFTPFGREEYSIEFLNEAMKYSRLIVVPGNCDPRRITDEFDRMEINLHGKMMDIHGNRFIGVGGSTPTFIPTPFMISDEEVRSILEHIMEKNSIIITHCPPFNCRDRAMSGDMLGYRAVAEVVEKYEPRLLLCGHVHEQRGVEKLGGTLVVNCSIGEDGLGTEIELSDEIDIKML